VASVALFLAIVLLPVFGVIVSLLTPLPLFYFYYTRGRSIGLVMIVLATAIISIILSIGFSLAGTTLFIGYGLLAAVMAESFGRRFSPEKIVGYPSAALLGFGLIILTLLSFSNGQNPWAYGQKMIKEHIQVSFKFYQEITNEMQQRPEFSEQELEDESGTAERPSRPVPDDQARVPSKAELPGLEQLTSVFVLIFPGLIIMGALLISWFNFMVGRILLTRNESLPGYLADLKKWKVQENLIWFVIGFGFFSILPFSFLRGVGINGLMVLSLIYFFAGLCVVAYWFDAKTVPYFLRALTYALIALQQYLGLIVVGLGLFDLWLDFRKLKKVDAGLQT
jgi:uncharacterized protein YybS (DUF2232 family)